jgi:hypothetical protein
MMREMQKFKAMAIVAAFGVWTPACTGDDEPQTCEPNPEHVYEPGTKWGPCLSSTCYPGQGFCDASETIGNICADMDCVGDHPACIEEPPLGSTLTAPTLVSGTDRPCLQYCIEGTEFECLDGMICAAGRCYWPLE